MLNIDKNNILLTSIISISRFKRFLIVLKRCVKVCA